MLRWFALPRTLQALFPGDWNKQFEVGEALARARAALEEIGDFRPEDQPVITEMRALNEVWKANGYPADGYARQPRAKLSDAERRRHLEHELAARPKIPAPGEPTWQPSATLAQALRMPGRIRLAGERT
jgi:hypothetical protein